MAGELARFSGRDDYGLSKKQMESLRDFVESRWDRTPSVAELAGAVGIGQHALTRRLRRWTNEGPHAFVMRLRIERAKELLRNPAMPLVEIAWGLGFSSQSHFSAVFRKYVGVSPGAFRKMI
jgi:AraC family transcriptional regulator